LVAGLGILFIGLQLLSSNLQNEAFRGVINFIFNSTSHPLLLIAIGVGLTMIVQSSSVVTSMVVFLIAGALLPLESALPLVVGANIGTCVTSWIASIGRSRTSRQTAMFHTIFNMVGAALFIAVIYTPLKEPFFDVVGSVDIHPEFKVAIFHLLFNLCAAVVMIPLLRPAVWLCKKIVRH
jgi:phosphate:Na+ symporter